MTTKFIDVTGKTEDEAVANALAQLGLDRDEVSVEILERAKKGFLGIGASPAKVRVTYEVVEEPVVKPVVEKKPAPAAPAAASRPAEKRQEKVAPVAVQQEEKRPERSEKKKPNRSRNDRRDRPQKAAEAPVESAPVQPVNLGEPVNDEKARQITAFLSGLLEQWLGPPPRGAGGHTGSKSQWGSWPPESIGYVAKQS